MRCHAIAGARLQYRASTSASKSLAHKGDLAWQRSVMPLINSCRKNVSPASCVHATHEPLACATFFSSKNRAQPSSRQIWHLRKIVSLDQTASWLQCSGPKKTYELHSRLSSCRHILQRQPEMGVTALRVSSGSATAAPQSPGPSP